MAQPISEVQRPCEMAPTAVSAAPAAKHSNVSNLANKTRRQVSPGHKTSGVKAGDQTDADRRNPHLGQANRGHDAQHPARKL